MENVFWHVRPSAWTRQNKTFYRVTLGGRSGKQYPRMGKMFLNWISEDALLQMYLGIGKNSQLGLWITNQNIFMAVI